MPKGIYRLRPDDPRWKFPKGPLQFRRRERQILGLVFGRKMNSKEVGWELGISDKTVHHNIENATKRHGFRYFWEMYPLYLRGFIV